MKKQSPLFALALLLLTGVIFLATHRPASLLQQGWPQVVERWNRGEIIMLIRHAERCDRSSAPCLEGNTGITKRGWQMARELGRAMAAHLDLKPSVRYHSPVKRTRQTARALFGDTSLAADWLRKNCKKQMTQALQAHKRPGINLVGVTHATCMARLQDSRGNALRPKATLGDDSYGITWFLTTDESGSLRALGYLLPRQWEKLALKPTPR